MEATCNIKPMTKSQLAQAYGICVRTLNKWMQPFILEIGTNPKTYIYNPEQIKTIFEKLGEP